nr:hypothetical protein [Lysobacter enzymogenes]
MHAAGRARVAFQHRRAAVVADDPVERYLSGVADLGDEAFDETADRRVRRGLEIETGTAAEPVRRPVNRMREQPAAVGDAVGTQLGAGVETLRDPRLRQRQRRRIGRHALRIQAHMHAETRILGLEHQRPARGPGARLLEIAYLGAVGHVRAATARQFEETQLAVQLAQLVELVHQHAHADRQRAAIARQPERLLAGRHDQIDAALRDDAGEVGREARRVEARASDRLARAHRVRPARQATGHAVGHHRRRAPVAAEAAGDFEGGGRAGAENEDVGHGSAAEWTGGHDARDSGETTGRPASIEACDRVGKSCDGLRCTAAYAATVSCERPRSRTATANAGSPPVAADARAGHRQRR